MKNLIVYCLCCSKRIELERVEPDEKDFFCSVGCLKDYENNLKFEFINDKENFEKKLEDLN